MAYQGITTFDELNQLVGFKRSEDFGRYFAPMKITTEQKRERRQLAERLYDEFTYALALMFYSYPNINTSNVEMLKERYTQALIDLGIIASTATTITATAAEYELQVAKFSADVVETTARRGETDPFYFSEDRARLLAEDQANAIYDTKDYGDALAGGLTLKTWQTVGDNHVRDTHAEIEGVTIPIDEPFYVGGYLMMHPHDASLGAGMEEIANCRCTLMYTSAAGVAVSEYL